MDNVARDLISRTDQLATDRIGWEQEWREIADFCLPSATREMMMTSMNGTGAAPYDVLAMGPSTKIGSRKRFDSTAISALDRLAAGMESLVSPQSEKWHEQATNDPLAPEPTDEEAKWFERLRDYQFDVRYTPMSGFANANQKYIRSICAMGTGVLFTEEAFGHGGRDQSKLPVLYQHLPISQCLIAVNAQGNPDTLHRRFSMTARQMMQKFGDGCSQKVKDAADDVKRMDSHVELIHAVCPRQEMGSRSAGNMRKSPVASYYIEIEGCHLINNSGFAEFPFGIGYWIQPESSAYGESPMMAALDDIRGLNVTRKTALRSMQQWTDPPIAVAHDGVMNRPNLNPRAVNFGAVDANGRSKIVPIITAQNPNAVQSIIEDQRNSVKELLYNNLFQILIQNPQMTAHEAMLRAAEKGDLLGPNGVKIQQGYAAMSDREVGIMERKGAFRPGASLEAPKSLAGRSFGARFTSQLDRMRQAKEGAGIMQAYSAAGQIAQVRGNADVFDNFDDDAAIKLLATVNGMPQKVMVNAEKRDAARQARAQAQAQMQKMQQAESMAKVAKDGGAGMSDIANAASIAGNSGMAPNVAPLQLPQLGPLGGPA